MPLYKKKIITRINHLTIPLQNVAYFTCASRETQRHICTTEVFLFAVLSQSKWEGEGVGSMLSSVKWQEGVCERMSRTIFAK